MDLSYIVERAKAAPLVHRQNAAKEALQECLLSALAQEGLLAGTAFIGGTALRILHQLPRFSEDLDFVWLDGEPDARPWSQAIKRYLGKIGVTPHLQLGARHTDARSGKRTQALYLAAAAPALGSFARDGLQVSFEFDFDPPAHTVGEVKILTLAYGQASIPTLTLPSLLAGKLHILLTRLDREKGRDWYDYLWYRRQEILPNVLQLESAIQQSGHTLPARFWMSYLRRRVQEMNWENLRNDVRPFLENPDELSQLNATNMVQLTPPPPFEELTHELKVEERRHPLFQAAADDPVRQDVDQRSLEGDKGAIDLDRALRALR